MQELRRDTIDKLEPSDSDATRAALALVAPLASYVEENPTAVYYVKLLSQLGALNSPVLNPSTRSNLSFHSDERLTSLLQDATNHLKPAEAQRRMYLVVSITFHGIADVCRASEHKDSSATLKSRRALFDQVVLAVCGTLSRAAPRALRHLIPLIANGQIGWLNFQACRIRSWRANTKLEMTRLAPG